MNAQHDGRKERSRESRYYHSRRARGDHLLRIWSDPQTAAMFRSLVTFERSEDAFKRIVHAEFARRLQADLEPQP